MTLPADAPVQPIEIDVVLAPPPDPALEPEGFLAGADGDARLHFLDWGGPDDGPGVLLIPGLLSPAWSWAPVARRLARVRRTCVMDLRGHGLSDAPPDGYDLETLAEDAAMVAEASGIAGADGRVVLAGQGFGGCVAAAAAAAIGERCAGLVLVDGGIERLGETLDVDADDLLRTLEEPPEVLRSMDAWLADRRAFDEASWDADQERAARDAVVETAAGHVVRAVRPFVVHAIVPTMLAYDPAEVLARVAAPVTVLVAMAAGDPGPRLAELRRAAQARVAGGGDAVGVVGFAGVAHNLPRYRPADVTAAILGAGR
jgi:pimeloyl-ACP methyl ester carboxylesterase